MFYGMLALAAIVFFYSVTFVAAQETLPDTTPPSIADITIRSVSENSITIDWTTNEPAIYTFEYGLTQSYGTSAAVSADASVSGTVALTGLTSDTAHYYCIHATDASGNAAQSCDTFTTEPTADTTPSIISGVANESVSSSDTKIVWITNEAAYSKVRYGRTTSLSSETTLETTATLLHETTLEGLSSDTKYYFCIDAKDVMGNSSESCGHTFTTARRMTMDDTEPPIISRSRRHCGRCSRSRSHRASC